MSHARLTPTSMRRAQRGFSLLEALVSIVVLSFGLLGVAGLQASSLKYTRDARNQSVAVNLARELAEMIRSNPRQSGKTTGNPYVLSSKHEDLSAANTPPTTCLDANSKCTDTDTDPDNFGAALAAAQLADWKHRVSKALPDVRIAVCFDSEPYYPNNYSDADMQGLPKSWADGCDGNGNVIAIKIGWARDGYDGSPAKTDKLPPFVVLPVTPAGQQ